MNQKPLALFLARQLMNSSLILSLALLGACSKSLSTESEDDAKQTSSVSNTPALEIVRVDDEAAEASAKLIEQQVQLTLAKGLTAKLWASEKMLGDTVAINVDDKGRIWAGITHRSNNSEFDIRNYPAWEQPSMTFSNIEDRRAFLHSELAPENSAKNEKIPDRNKDGSHDWKDLAVMQEEVVRLEDTTGNGTADIAQTVLRDFNTEVTDVIGGMFYDNQNDALFINVAPDLWKVKDTNGDGVMDDKKSLAFGFGVHIGFSGHGLSGATIGPDGRIYYSMGDIGTSVKDSNGKTWHYPNQGVIVRSELDGSNFEVFASGVRNIYEFSFDKFGNFISVDNDGDHVGEYERIVYLIDGSDSGWRTNWQLGKYKDPKNNTYKVWMDENYFKPRFTDQAAHILPPIAPYYAGPTGMTYNPGTGLSEQWNDHFFVVEFVGSSARAGINAFTLKPEGASFKLATDQNIFRGVLATGLDFGPDGALYMSDWIEGWSLKQKGRIWKLDTPETANSELRKTTKKLLGESFSQYSAKQLLDLLANSDMRVRQKAQFELVARANKKELLKAARKNSSQIARIHALWGLGQLARKDSSLSKNFIPFLTDSDTEVRAQAAKLIGDAPIKEASEALITLLGDESARVKFFAAQALGRIGDDEAIEPLIFMLAANNEKDVYLRQAGAIALARIGNEHALSELASHSSEAVRVAAVVALKRIQSPALALFLNDTSEFVVTNAARAIGDDDFVVGALPALAKILDAPRFSNEPLLRRAINANLYASNDNTMDSAQNAARLVQFAQQKKYPGTLRAEAINTLAVWASSSQFDRVTGQYRGTVTHNSDEALNALTQSYKKLLKDKNSKVRVATISALGGLKLLAANEQLIATLAQDSSPTVRIATLAALEKLNPEDMSKSVFLAMNDKDESVRMAALTLLPELNLPVADVVKMHELLLDKGTIGEQQAAYSSLVNVKAPEAYAVITQKVQQLIAGKIAPEVQLELLTVAGLTVTENTGVNELAELLTTYENSKDKNNPLDMYRESLLGGDAKKGRDLFRYSTSAQCVRCHMVSGDGAHVGPELTKIATVLKREQLLEALVNPNARVAPGFGTVSGMPMMSALLSRTEIRDLVAYLSTLNGAEEVHEGH
jgi:quinoprotein glucose dehydrogenase